jgi:hypothetical protein
MRELGAYSTQFAYTGFHSPSGVVPSYTRGTDSRWRRSQDRMRLVEESFELAGTCLATGTIVGSQKPFDPRIANIKIENH